MLSYGPEFAWHNFMLTNSHTLQYENGQARFAENSKPTAKSKFVVPHINLPVLLNIGLKKEGFHFGVGGYIGYRIGGYTKVVYKEPKNKEKYNESLGLNDLKYGLTAEVGHRNRGTLFIRYDLSELFRSSQVNARDMQAFSFGIRI
ncbi:MAG: outer membrane beta-barrel protein [Leadbetterella sp.]|nr:outer membrane beta-barrel protein [Leadbetterella sp.]